MQLASEKALEFDAVRLLLAHCTASPMGRSLAEALEPLTSIEEVRAEQARLTAVRRLRDQDCRFDFGAFTSIESKAPGLRALKPVLEPLDLYSIASALQEAAAYQQLLESFCGDAPELTPVAEDLEIDAWIAEEILRAIDSSGELLDEASAELTKLRESLRSARTSINVILRRFFDGECHPNYVQDEFITIRGGRLVIPIKIEHRTRHRGIVHDRSRSGDSLFFEPIEAVELNNSLAELHAEAQLEEARILARLTSALYDNWPEVCRVLNAMARLDLLTAKARLAETYDGVEPTFTDGGPLVIFDARHPLLDERLGKLKAEAGTGSGGGGEQPVVPITIRLGEGWRVLVITGPNAGGKTVTLKTAGLLALMAQAGMQVPAREYRGPVFRVISADIGDYQDILSHLSTFSSHLMMLKQLFRQLETPALVLLDEIAAATDPGEGSALAMAVLEQLHVDGAFVIASTHLEAIKAFVHVQEGMENACVEFDPETMRPTFQLRYGLPGSSNALETAREIGLPPELLKRARSHLGEEVARASEIIVSLQEELAAVRREREELREKSRSVEATQERYAKRLEAAGEREQRKLQQILAEWHTFKLSRERDVQATLESMKKAGSLQEARAVAREEAHRLEAEFEALKMSKRRRRSDRRDGGGPLAEGEAVEVPGFGRSGVVLRSWRPERGKNVAVEIEGKRIALPRGSVIRKGGKAKRERKPARIKIVVAERAPESELNVVGLSVDEALMATERFLDKALLDDLPWVRIVHGRGTGALRKAIAAQLKGQPHVSGWHQAEPAAGGSAVTVIEFTS